MVTNNKANVWVQRIFLIGLLFAITIIFTIVSPAYSIYEDTETIEEQFDQLPLLDFVLLTSPEEDIELEEIVDLIIRIENLGDITAVNYTFYLYATTGITLPETKEKRDLYDPLLETTLNIPAGDTVELTLPIYLLSHAKNLEGIALVHEKEIVSRLEIYANANQILPEPLADYNMPVPPNVSCPSPPPISPIGSAVISALNSYYFDGDYSADAYFSSLTWCNQFSGDWVLDVPNVSSATTPTSAEDFYTMIADLIRNTEYIFSLSTLGFSTHDKSGDQNLVRHYLAPAIRDLHDNTPVNGPYPLLRFAVSKSNTYPQFDTLQEIYEDLSAELPTDQPWRVSIAVASIGWIPGSPWNHSKIAVHDYRQTIVGGINWKLDYILPVDINGDGNHAPTIEVDGHILNVHRLYDLSISVEGDATQAAAIYFDKLWKRNIDPLFPHLGNDCVTSWDIPFYWTHDCPLRNVPEYAPNGNQIPDYYLSNSEHVFSLGRGRTNWGAVSPRDDSADVAILAAFNAAEETIYISQHKLTLAKNVNGWFTFVPEVKDALLDAVLRGVRVKIALSEPWGSGTHDSVLEIYEALVEELYPLSGQAYPNDPQLRANAICHLEVAPFRVPLHPLPEDFNHIYHTHSKFFMVDEEAFYVGSQNLYPGGIGTFHPNLNEYGFLVDNPIRSVAMKDQYWTPIWEETNAPGRAFQPPYGFLCVDGIAYFGVYVDLIYFGVTGAGSGQILVSWETAVEFTPGFNIYRSTSPDPETWSLVHFQQSEGGGAIGGAYEWIDTDVLDNIVYYYWLEDVDPWSPGLWGPESTTTALP